MNPLVRPLRSIVPTLLLALLGGCGALGVTELVSAIDEHIDNGGGPGGGGTGQGGTAIGTAAQQYNLDRLNAYRAQVGSPALVMDTQLNTFATAGSQQLQNDHDPHAHFNQADLAGTLFTTDGFVDTAGENQGDPNGWFPMPGGINAQIDAILASMWAEGPGGGHYDNMVNPAFTRVGIGLVTDGFGRLYFTNDFSGG
jgi:uncharacterized protein YkwD